MGKGTAKAGPGPKAKHLPEDPMRESAGTLGYQYVRTFFINYCCVISTLVRHREMITFPAATEVFISNSTSNDVRHLHRYHFTQTRDTQL